jgi:hypothetical protein
MAIPSMNVSLRSRTVRIAVAVAVMGGASLTLAVLPPARAAGTTVIGSHPRLWLSPQMVADIAAKRAASDPDWLSVKASADGFLQQAVPKVTITGASNTNPVQFTSAENLPWTGTARTVYLAGASGAWTAVNNQPPAGAWAATKTGSRTFTIPVNASSFGSFAGQSVTFFMAGGEDSGYITYGASGSGWKDAFTQLGIVSRVAGGGAYSAKALELLDWIGTLGAARMTSPVSQDSGRGSLGATLGVALGYDWFYQLLSPSQKTAIYTTLNVWNTWTAANAYAINDPSSNYWANHITGAAATGYATFDENPQAQSWLDWVANNWSTNFDPKFFNPPSTTAKGADDRTGFYYGGLAVTGFNYGGNDISRLAKYYDLVKTASGTELPKSLDYQKRWARNLIYNLKPDRFKSPTFGQWTGAWTGIMTLSEALLLSHTLAGTPEGAWMQWFYDHVAPPPPGAEVMQRAEIYDRLMFYNSTRASSDYRTTQPPFFFSDGGEANVYWRSDWSDSAHYALFNASGAHYSGSTPKYSGHLDLTRGTDYLLVQSNYWKGTGDGTTGSPELDWAGSAYANTLYFWDGGDTAGGRCFTSATYEGCQTGFGIYKAPLQKLTKDYAFVQNDFATAYDYFQIPDKRTLQYFFRSFVALGDGVYVVSDRIRSTSATHTKQIRWQLSSASTPVVSGSLITSTVGASKLFVNTVLPASARVALVRNLSTGGAAGNWRAEVTDPAPSSTYTGLTVLYATSSTGTLPTITRLTNVDSGFEALQIGGNTPKVAVLAKGVTDAGNGIFTSAASTKTAFTTDHTGTATYVVAGLAPGSYSVTRNGAPLPDLTSLIVDSSGSLMFTAQAGAFAIALVGTVAEPLPSPTPGLPTPTSPTPTSDNPTLAALACNPATVSIQGRANCTVTVSPAAANALTVRLTTSSPSVDIPASVIVASNANSAYFIVDPSRLSTSSTVVISATLAAETQRVTLNVTSATGGGDPTAPVPPPSTDPVPPGDPAAPAQGKYTCTNDQFSMSTDITLRNDESVELVGTASRHCVVNGNGHRFVVADASWTGHFRARYVDFSNVGAESLDILGGQRSGDYAYLGSGSYLDIQDSTFQRSSGFNLYTGVDSYVIFKRNVYASDNLVSVNTNAALARPWFKESGPSTAPKFFQGNRIFRSWIEIGSPNWVIGAAPGCSTQCDVDGNILVGKRVGFTVRGNGAFVSYNYTHSMLDVTPDVPVWSQVYNLGALAAGSIAENNIFRTGHWVANGIDGTLRYNVLAELEPHQFVRIGNGGSVHHNILLTRFPGINTYTLGTRPASGDSAFGLVQAGNTLSIYNNTMDMRGAAVKSLVWVVNGATLTSWRNNVAYRLKLLARGCPTSECTSAVSPDFTEGYVTPPPARAIYMDYNSTFFDPTTERSVVYDLATPGRSLCQPGMGAHDIGLCANSNVDQQFRGPLPMGTGQSGTGSRDESGFPFNDSDILNGVYKVSDILSYFRWVYAPASNSPLRGAQDPQDGAGDIGAVQTSSLPATPPAIVTSNKRPMVYAGPSFGIADTTAVAKLSGYAADDSLPSGTLTLQWSVVSGPGSVDFSSPTTGYTTARFSANGLYTLRLTASDGSSSSTSDVSIGVGAGFAPVALLPTAGLAAPKNVRIVR